MATWASGIVGGKRKTLRTVQVGSYLMRDFPRGRVYVGRLWEPIREGIQALEIAELVKRTIYSDISGLNVTGLGLQAIEEGSALKYPDGQPAS